VQYLLVFLVLLCVFGGGAYLVLCNIESALFVALNIKVKKLFVVGTCKP
jgi:hypothetical protein